MWLYILLGIIVGIIAELLAYTLKLWLYKHALFWVSNVLLMFGVVGGVMSYTAMQQGNLALAVFAMGMLGLVYEVVNIYKLKLWTFPAKTIPWLKGNTAVVATTAAWAGVPVLVATGVMVVGKLLR